MKLLNFWKKMYLLYGFNEMDYDNWSHYMEEYNTCYRIDNTYSYTNMYNLGYIIGGHRKMKFTEKFIYEFMTDD